MAFNYHPGNALDFSPLTQGFNALAQQGQHANALDYQRGRDQVQDQRAQKTLDAAKGKEALNQMAGIYQAIEAAPETDRPAMLQRAKPMIDRLRSMDPDWDADAQAAGYAPDDYAGIGRLVIGRARGPVDPLEAQYKQAQINKLNKEASDTGALGLVPIYGVDAQGNSVVMQPSKGGELRQSKLPEGVTVDPMLNAQRKKLGTELGDAQGKAQVNLPLAEKAATRITEQIDKVMNAPGLQRVTGTVYGRLPKVTNTSGPAKEAQSRIDQILGGTFLQAYNDLRGAGQISNAEGQAAKEAYNRLQSQELDTPQYQEALMEFKTEVENLVEIARRKAGGGAAAPAPANGGFKYLGPAS
jgi:hypothetical protein